MLEIKKLEEKLLLPSIRKSRQDLEVLLADEFIEFSSSGRIYNKVQVINALITEESSLYSLENFRVKMLSDSIVLATYFCQKEDHDRIIKSVRSSIWKKVDDVAWAMFFHQGTPIWDV